MPQQAIPYVGVERTILTWRIRKDECCRVDGSGWRICYQITVRVEVGPAERRQRLRCEHNKTPQYGTRHYAFPQRCHMQNGSLLPILCHSCNTLSPSASSSCGMAALMPTLMA